jgi:Fe-Mn family superoxide dismutase
MISCISAGELKKVCHDLTAVVILDVRKRGARAKEPAMIVNARYREPAAVGEWKHDFSRDQNLVVYCVHGHEVSQGVCQNLHDDGYQVQFLEGGIESWKESGGPVTEPRT